MNATSRRGPRILTALVALAFFASSAAAQDDPTFNESELDSDLPQDDSSYIDDDSDWNSTSSDSNTTTDDGTTDPTLTESELDASLPADDDSFLSDEFDEPAGSGTEESPNAATPGPGSLLVVGVLGALAVALKRRD